MGGCFSSRSSSTSNSVRLVHFSGFVEDFEQPIYVSEVTGNPPKHFVCTSIQLLSPSCSKPLKGDTQLQPGHVYFILPYSILESEASPLDFASLAKRLTSIAKSTSRCEDKNALKANSPLMSSQNGVMTEEPPSGVAYGGRIPCRMQPWKPILDTINEKSFTRRSESDLQENI